MTDTQALQELEQDNAALRDEVLKLRGHNISITQKWSEDVTKLREEVGRLSGIVRQANSDWGRLRDFIVGESPTEMFRFQEAVKNAKGVQIFQSYIASLWNEAGKRKTLP